ncbi:uncharacterized protein LOC115884099 [Sitophilus oryzae]|uniref:Uncharacterized protein LOC115884099 n=1 Tax=Sitophilus oryzae TaxID=7048 RepID=A0A6J2Y435_SITOR|nr:uncharacterized protein LOC115884099 [Sitophilus oryzae]
MRILYVQYEKWGLQVSLKKTEYLVVNSEAAFEVLITDDTQVTQVNNFKYLGSIVTKQGIGEDEIKLRIQAGKRVVGCLNSLWWDQHLSLRTKKRLRQILVESVVCYGCEVWALTAEMKRRVTAVEMNYLRRSAGVSKMDRITNIEIRHRMNAPETIIDRAEIRGLKWFGHLSRMPEDEWPLQSLKSPPQRRKRGRPRRSWNNTIRQEMASRELEELDAFDREVWRRRMGKQQ